MYYVIGGLGILAVILIIIFLIKSTRVQNVIHCPAKTWTTVVSNFGTGTPREIKLTFKSNDHSPVQGRYLEQKYLWVFPQDPSEGALKAEMTFHREWINGIYKLKIYPEADIEVTIT